MRKVYLVTRQSCGAVMSTETAKTWPRAARLMHEAVWDMYDANGLRDRPCAWRGIRAAERLTCNVTMATIELDAFASVTLQTL